MSAELARSVAAPSPHHDPSAAPPIAPGKRTATQNMRGPAAGARLDAPLKIARAALDEARDEHLPALRAAIDARAMKKARAAADALRAALATIDRELADAGDAATDPEVAALRADADALRADAEPVLAKAPPPAPDLPDLGPWLLAHSPPPESYGLEEHDNEQTWRDQLGTKEGESGAIEASPASKRLRIGDRYSLRFLGGRAEEASSSWSVSPGSDLVSIHDEKTAAGGAEWSAEVEGEAAGFAAVTARQGSGSGVAYVTVDQPKAAIETKRIHQPAEFEDPVSSVLYPQDWIRARATLDVGEHSKFGGRLTDTAGLLKTVSAQYSHPTLTVWARAESTGHTTPMLELMPNARSSGLLLPIHDVDVVPALAGEEQGHRDGPRRVKTTDLGSAVRLLGIELEQLLLSQRSGVLRAKGELLQRRAKQKVPWWLGLFVAGVEGAIAFATAGIGNRVGRALSKYVSVERDLGAVFDLENALGSAFKDSLKKLARGYLTDKGPTDDTTVEEPWAIDLFCEAQMQAFEIDASNAEAAIVNEFDSFKKLEDARSGAGLAAVEARRHALGAQKEYAAGESFHATLREWLKIQSQSSHGREVLRDQNGDAIKDANGSDKVGSNLGNAGRGHIVLSIGIDKDDPVAAATATRISFTGLMDTTAEMFKARGGRLIDLGIPYEVASPREFRLGRNEVGDVWITFITGAMGIDAGWSKSAKRYLHEKAMGKQDPGAEVSDVSVREGARKILEEEIGAIDVKDIPLATSGWGSDR